MGIRQQVKTGALTIADAQNLVDPKGKCAAWLDRRSKKTRKEKASE